MEERTKTCPQCGAKVSYSAKSCEHCGYFPGIKNKQPQRPICPRCNQTVPYGARVCPNCGCNLRPEGSMSPHQAPANPTFCRNCGAVVQSGSGVCPRCGESTQGYSQSSNYGMKVRRPGAMPKKTRMINCKSCGRPVDKSAKSCPSCGMRLKKPFYKRWWFWLIIVLVVINVPIIPSDDSGAGNADRDVIVSTTPGNSSDPGAAIIDNPTTPEDDSSGHGSWVTVTPAEDKTNPSKFDDTGYSYLAYDVLYDYRSLLIGESIITVVYADDVYSTHISYKIPGSDTKLSFDFGASSEVKGVAEGSCVTIAGVVDSVSYNSVRLKNCKVIGSGEIAQQLKADAEAQRSSLLQRKSELVLSHASDVDTSGYMKLYRDVLYEYGNSLTGQNVVTVITVKDISGSELKTGTDNNSGFFYSIICKFQDSSYISGVSEGDLVTVAGTVDEPGSIGSTKTLKNCIIIGLGELEQDLKSGVADQTKICQGFVAQEKAAEEAAIAQTKSDYISGCQSFGYNDVARNPDSYKGKQIKISGKVIQESEGWFDSLTLRVQNGDNIWLVTYTYSDGESRILEDDNITVYGECTGVTSYKSILGQTITIPSVKMKYYKIS